MREPIKLPVPDATSGAIAEPRITDITYRRRAEALKAERDQLRQQVEKLEHDLAECYRLTGSDPDGDSDSMLAKHAVQAVHGLREEADKVGEWEERLDKLVGRTVDLRAYRRANPGDPLDRLYQAADQVRKELEGR